MSLDRRTLLTAAMGMMVSACQKRTPAVAIQPPAPQAPPPSPAQSPKPPRPAAKAAPASPAPAPTVTPAPRLTEMLSADDQRRYNQQIDQDLRSARENLARLPVQRTENQKALAMEVAAFIQQAEALRRTDLITARGFAQKASVLAREAVAGTP